jgi:hypothetical protein
VVTAGSVLDALPPELPDDLRAFLECRADRATLTAGPVTWVRIPPGARGLVGEGPPVLEIQPGSTSTSATLRLSLGWLTVALPAAVSDGRLVIDTGKLPLLTPGGVKREIQRFVDDLNGRLAAHGKQLGPPEFSPTGMTLSKVDRAE